MIRQSGSVRKGAVVALSLAALSACTTPFTCPAGDWQRAGFRDALAGRSTGYIAGYAEVCGGAIGGADRDAWARGHSDGLARYCTPRHAEWLGQNRAYYNPGSCPIADRKRLNDAYYEGRSYRAMVDDLRREFYRDFFRRY